MFERTNAPSVWGPSSIFMMAAPGPEPVDRPRSAFEERLRGWMAASERRFEANMVAGDVLELTMLDIVGEDWWTGGGITSKAVQQKLSAYPKAKTIKILLNSPGGDAFEGLAVQSILRRHGARVEVEVVGLAASAASIIAMAGDDIAMHEGSLMMVHQPWTFAVGDADEMRTCAEFLDKVNDSGLDVYTRRTGRERKDVAALVAAETWMTAHEAVKEKFATSVVEGAAPEPIAKASAAARVFMSARTAPRSPRSQIAANGDIEPKDVLAAMQHEIERQRSERENSAPPAPVPSAKNPGTGEGTQSMKTISLVAVMAALGYTAEQQASAEENDVLEALKKVKQRADEPKGSTISGVKLLGVSTEEEAAVKLGDLTKLSMAVMGATGASSNAEAVVRMMGWKTGSENAGDLAKQVGELNTKMESHKLEAAIQRLSREGKLAPAQHEWARANFKTADSLETFALTLPSLANIGAHEPNAGTNLVSLSADERTVCKQLGITEEMFLEQKKLEAQQRNARVGG